MIGQPLRGAGIGDGRAKRKWAHIRHDDFFKRTVPVFQPRLYGSAKPDDMIGLGVEKRKTAEKLCRKTAHDRHTRSTTHKHNLIDLGDIDARVAHGTFHGRAHTAQKRLHKLFKLHPLKCPAERRAFNFKTVIGVRLIGQYALEPFGLGLQASLIAAARLVFGNVMALKQG